MNTNSNFILNFGNIHIQYTSSVFLLVFKIQDSERLLRLDLGKRQVAASHDAIGLKSAFVSEFKVKLRIARHIVHGMDSG
jgi:hypothetical protein